MPASRFCKICRNWHMLDEPWPENCFGHYRQASAGVGLQIIKDIDPYRTVAADKATGKRVNIGSRREHREFLRRNAYIEIGNEIPKMTRPEPKLCSKADIKAAIEQVKAGKGAGQGDARATNIFGGQK